MARAGTIDSWKMRYLSVYSPGDPLNTGQVNEFCSDSASQNGLITHYACPGNQSEYNYN
jgi:hypothetical protein